MTRYNELLLKAQRDSNLINSSILMILAGNTGNKKVLLLAEGLVEQSTINSNEITEFINESKQ